MCDSGRAYTNFAYRHSVIGSLADLAAATEPADYWDKHPERITAITKEQVQAAANKYLDPGHVQIVAVGDAKKIGESPMKFGPVEVYDTEGRKIGQ